MFFLLCHYGSFMGLGCGKSLVGFLKFSLGRRGADAEWPGELLDMPGEMQFVFWTMLASYATAFCIEFLGQGLRYRHQYPGLMMLRPYVRIVMLSGALVIGLLFAAKGWSSVIALTLLMLAKIALELWSHSRERKRLLKQ